MSTRTITRAISVVQIAIVAFASACSAPPDLPKLLAPPPSKMVAMELQELEVTPGDGAPRSFLVSAPRDDPRALPLVLVFHGGGGSAESMRAYADLESRAHSPAIYVYPRARVAHVWADEYATHWDATQDIAFVDAILTRISKTRRIGNVYALGLSSGAYFVNQLACERANVIHGIVAIEGGGPFGECDRTAKVSALIVHDPDDPVVPASEGAATLQHFLAADVCKSSAKSLDNMCIMHECADQSRVVECRVHGGLHAIASGIRDRAIAFMNL